MTAEEGFWLPLATGTRMCLIVNAWEASLESRRWLTHPRPGNCASTWIVCTGITRAAVVSESSQALLAQKLSHCLGYTSQLMDIPPSHWLTWAHPGHSHGAAGLSSALFYHTFTLIAAAYITYITYINSLQLPQQTKWKAQTEELFALVSG